MIRSLIARTCAQRAQRLLVIDDFRARYRERVVDRLREVGTWITVIGPSMRGRR